MLTNSSVFHSQIGFGFSFLCFQPEARKTPPSRPTRAQKRDELRREDRDADAGGSDDGGAGAGGGAGHAGAVPLAAAVSVAGDGARERAVPEGGAALRGAACARGRDAQGGVPDLLCVCGGRRADGGERRLGDEGGRPARAVGGLARRARPAARV